MLGKAQTQNETPSLRRQHDLKQAIRKFRVLALVSVLAILMVLFGPRAWNSWQLEQFGQELASTAAGNKALFVSKHHAMLVNNLKKLNQEKATQLLGAPTLIGTNGFIRWNWKDENGTTASIEMTFDKSGQNSRLSVGHEMGTVVSDPK